MKALVVGVGGLGCPAAIVLARAAVETIGIADEDLVDPTNLHRQILFDDGDVGRSKVPAAIRKLEAIAPRTRFVAHDTRLLPNNAVDLVAQYDVVVEGSDNFATKFLAADAARLAKKPIVHGAAVRWHGTALAVGPGGTPCYRCLFEDVPRENAPNCAEAGVIGPMVGVVAAVQADLALSILRGDGDRVFGTLFTFDGKTLASRRRTIPPRAACPLCGPAPEIRSIDGSRYVATACDI
jgi:adenylyltransferase/sulfurtransferase